MEKYAERTARWWIHTGRYTALFDPPGECLQCPVCGFQIDYDEPPDECPACGVKMDADE